MGCVVQPTAPIPLFVDRQSRATRRSPDSLATSCQQSFAMAFRDELDEVSTIIFDDHPSDLRLLRAGVLNHLSESYGIDPVTVAEVEVSLAKHTLRQLKSEGSAPVFGGLAHMVTTWRPPLEGSRSGYKYISLRLSKRAKDIINDKAPATWGPRHRVDEEDIIIGAASDCGLPTYVVQEIHEMFASHTVRLMKESRSMVVLGGLMVWSSRSMPARAEKSGVGVKTCTPYLFKARRPFKYVTAKMSPKAFKFVNPSNAAGVAAPGPVPVVV